MVLFTCHDGTQRSYESAELSELLARLNAANSSSCVGVGDVAFHRVGTGQLLILDVGWYTGRRLHELFTIVSVPANEHTLGFQDGGSTYTLSQALLDVGSPATLPVVALADVFMHLYSQFDLRYVEGSSSNWVVSEGVWAETPAVLKGLTAGTGIAVTPGGVELVVAAALTNEPPPGSALLDESTQTLRRVQAGLGIGLSGVDGLTIDSALSNDAVGSGVELLNEVTQKVRKIKPTATVAASQNAADVELSVEYTQAPQSIGVTAIDTVTKQLRGLRARERCAVILDDDDDIGLWCYSAGFKDNGVLRPPGSLPGGVDVVDFGAAATYDEPSNTLTVNAQGITETAPGSTGADQLSGGYLKGLIATAPLSVSEADPSDTVLSLDLLSLPNVTGLRTLDPSQRARGILPGGYSDTELVGGDIKLNVWGTAIRENGSLRAPGSLPGHVAELDLGTHAVYDAGAHKITYYPPTLTTRSGASGADLTNTGELKGIICDAPLFVNNTDPDDFTLFVDLHADGSSTGLSTLHPTTQKARGLLPGGFSDTEIVSDGQDIRLNVWGTTIVENATGHSPGTLNIADSVRFLDLGDMASWDAPSQTIALKPMPQLETETSVPIDVTAPPATIDLGQQGSIMMYLIEPLAINNSVYYWVNQARTGASEDNTDWGIYGSHWSALIGSEMTETNRTMHISNYTIQVPTTAECIEVLPQPSHWDHARIWSANQGSSGAGYHHECHVGITLDGVLQSADTADTSKSYMCGVVKVTHVPGTAGQLTLTAVGGAAPTRTMTSWSDSYVDAALADRARLTEVTSLPIDADNPPPMLTLGRGNPAGLELYLIKPLVSATGLVFYWCNQARNNVPSVADRLSSQNVLDTLIGSEVTATNRSYAQGGFRLLIPTVAELETIMPQNAADGLGGVWFYEWIWAADRPQAGYHHVVHAGGEGANIYPATGLIDTDSRASAIFIVTHVDGSADTLTLSSSVGGAPPRVLTPWSDNLVESRIDRRCRARVPINTAAPPSTIWDDGGIPFKYYGESWILIDPFVHNGEVFYAVALSLTDRLQDAGNMGTFQDTWDSLFRGNGNDMTDNDWRTLNWGGYTFVFPSSAELVSLFTAKPDCWGVGNWFHSATYESLGYHKEVHSTTLVVQSSQDNNDYAYVCFKVTHVPAPEYDYTAQRVPVLDCLLLRSADGFVHTVRIDNSGTLFANGQGPLT